MKRTIEKSDVVLAIGNALMRLGKNDWNGCGQKLDTAKLMLNEWLIQERKNGRHKTLCVDKDNPVAR